MPLAAHFLPPGGGQRVCGAGPSGLGGGAINARAVSDLEVPRAMVLQSVQNHRSIRLLGASVPVSPTHSDGFTRCACNQRPHHPGRYDSHIWIVPKLRRCATSSGHSTNSSNTSTPIGALISRVFEYSFTRTLTSETRLRADAPVRYDYLSVRPCTL